MAGANIYQITLASGGPDTVDADTFTITPDGSGIVFSANDDGAQAYYKVANVVTVVALTPATAPTFSPAGGRYSGTQTVTISTTTADATIYYTLDGTTPTVESPVYSTPVSRTVPGAIYAIAVASGYGMSAVGSATYLVS